jgi:hypothetical protein
LWVGIINLAVELYMCKAAGLESLGNSSLMNGAKTMMNVQKTMAKLGENFRRVNA